MEPLLPSEIARLVYGYLLKEKNEETAKCFLQTSPHLIECCQMFNSNRSFNIKVYGFNLHDIFDLFGTMCKMINDQTPETFESNTLIEKLQYLLNANHMPIKEDKCVETESNLIDKCVETESNLIDKCVGTIVNTQDKSTHTSKNIEENNSTEVLEIPSFSELISSNVAETKKIDSVDDIISETVEQQSTEFTSPSLSSTTQLINNICTPTFSKIENEESPKFKINNQVCSTPILKNVDPVLQLSQNKFSPGLLECQQIPEATSLESMPGLSKGDKPEDNSIIIDTGELVDTLLNDRNKSLLETIAYNINKSMEDQKGKTDNEQGNFLNPPALEKALDFTQSDPQIKNVLDEFLVFNVDNDDGKKTCTIERQNTIKSRLRSSKKKDDVPSKSKKNILKQESHDKEEDKNCDNNIILMMSEEGNLRPTYYEHFEMVSNQLILQTNSPNVVQAYNLNTIEIEPEDEYIGKSNYVKIAPRLTPMVKSHTSILEKRIFPKRRKQSLQECGIRSKFRKSNITPAQTPESVQSTQSIIIEVPNQNSFETQAKNNLEIDNIRLPDMSKDSEVPSVVKDIIDHDTPDDRLKPPKNKSMSTPRRRSTHIRTLDFSTPQPKNKARDQARSKLFCDTPKRHETILEEPSSSPLPKLQADWGSVNGFESIVKKNTTKFWDTDIREMVGAGILTSDADGRKSRKKKTPRKKIKSVNDKNNSELVVEEQNKSNNDLIQTNESLSDEINQPNTSENNPCALYDQESYRPLLDDQKCEDQCDFPISKSPDKNTELYFEKPLDKSDSLKSACDQNSLNNQNEFPISLETPVKITELYNQQPSSDINSLKNSNDNITELCNKQLPIESNSLKSSQIVDDLELSKNNINEQENNLNQLNTTVNTASKLFATPDSKIELELTKKTDTNFLETFNNQNYLKLPLSIKQPENHLNEQSEHLKKQVLQDLIETNHSNKLSSPIKCIDKIQPIKHNIIETPFKCDDTAVDVPETPISKLIREYDPSKLVTPLPCTPDHYEDSLTETPLSKVLRETSYLNRPPISPFPPTPGNSRSVDTFLASSEQECSKTLISMNNINSLKDIFTQPNPTTTTQPIPKDKSSIKAKKIKPTPVKAKLKVSTRNKVKSSLKNKVIEATKKQVYESVKVEVFGSEISSSSSADEIDDIKEQNNTLITTKKIEVKKSGFKPIPRRKLIQPLITSSVIKGIKSDLSNELILKYNKSSPSIPAIEQNENNFIENSKKILNNKQLQKSKKSMVHFEDPVEQIINLSTNQKKFGKIQNKSITKNKTSKLNNSDNCINYLQCNPDNVEKISNTSKKNIDIQRRKIFENGLLSENKKSNRKESLKILNKSNNQKKISSEKLSQVNETKTRDMNHQRNIISHNKCTTDGNYKYNRKEKSTILNKSNLSMDSMQSMPINTKADQNCIFNMNNTIFNKSNQSEPTIINNNTSCVTVHSDESKIHESKVDVSLNLMDYFKKPKIYEVITDDCDREMVYLNLSEKFTFLDIPSELDNIQLSNPIPSPLLSTIKTLDITPEIEPGELTENILIPATSTPKDVVVEKKLDERQNRARRSPSFWEDSVHNYPINKYRDCRYRESNHWRNTSYHVYHDRKYNRPNKSRYDDRSQFDNRNRFQRNQREHFKRELRDDSIKDKERAIQKKEDKRRSYRDYNNYDERKERDLFEESKRFSNSYRKSQIDSQKSNRVDDIVKKATKRTLDRTDHKIPAKVSKVEHQRLLKNVNVDDFLSVVHGQK